MFLFAAEGAHETGTLLERYLDLITDPAHILLEITLILVVDVLIGIVLWPLIKRLVRRHDRDHHDHEC